MTLEGADLTKYQVTYAATVLAFLGAPHWGYAMAVGSVGTFRMIWGVIPSLVAWSALNME